MNNQRFLIYLVVSMHIAGTIGLQTSWRWLFELLTPLHLLTTTLILLWSQAQDRRYLLAGLIVMAITFIVEMIGVNTGLLFGQYSYGQALGPKLWGTPFIIGCNWVLLSFSIGHIFYNWAAPVVLKSFFGAIMMVGVDVFIEPVAMANDFWSWRDDVVPMQNYLGWGILSFLLFLGLFRWIRFEENRLAIWVFGAQVFFFLVLNKFFE